MAATTSDERAPAKGDAPAPGLRTHVQPARVLVLLAGVLVLAGVTTVFVGARRIADLDSNGQHIAALGATSPLTSIDQITGERSIANLYGREVELLHVPVARVLGDYGFEIGSGADTIVVLLRGELTHRQPEGETQVDAGDEVMVYGVIRKALTEGPEVVDPSTRAAITEGGLYVSAERVDVLRSSSPGDAPSSRP